MKDAIIQLVPFDPQWSELFRVERDLLQNALRPWLRGPIEHIGSTAVPGLDAKPIIDIMAAVGTLEESLGAIAAARALNYLYAPYRQEVEHWFCKPHPSFRTHHLHLVPYGSPTWIATITFRDKLREDPAIAAGYLGLKRQLATSFAHDREAYTNGKLAFITKVITEALGK